MESYRIRFDRIRNNNDRSSNPVVVKLTNQVRQLLPGLALLLLIGVLAKVFAQYVPLVSHLIIAVAIGVVLTNAMSLPSLFNPGAEKYKLLLEMGIVLMGATLSIDSLIEVGPTVLVLVIIISLMTILVIETVSRMIFGFQSKLSSLLAAGASICGVSAVVAVAGGIRAEEKHIAYAVAVVLVFDTITLFTYPMIGRLLSLSDTVFGLWAGLTMFSTGPVVAAGFEYSSESGQLATVTKLTRNLFISIIVIVYSSYYIRRSASTDVSALENGRSSTDRARLLWEKFPKFIFGFVLVMSIANIGLLSDAQIQSAENAYQWLFLFAFSGLGFQIQIKEMRQAGKEPLLIVFISFFVISLITLFALLWWFS